MSKIQKFEDLDIWKNAIEIAVQVTNVFESKSLEKDFELKNQSIRAAISISNNIAEGFEYDNNKDFIKFLRYAKGSTGEVRSLLHLLYRVNKISRETFEKMYEYAEVESKKIKTLIKYLESKTNR